MSSVATLPQTDVVDIPVIIRGRVIQPDEHAVEFGGRDGARFRQADPRRFARELVLANAGELRDLHDTPMDEIIDFLDALGGRLTLDNPMIQLAFDLALAAGGMTEPVLRPIYEHFPKLFNRDRLSAQIDAHIGKAYLDGWVEQGVAGSSLVRVRAVGTRQLHIIAGNVPVTAALTVIRGALTKGDVLIKTPSNDPLTAAAVVQAMVDMAPDHPVTRHFAVAYWKGGDEAVERAVITPTRIEKLTAWGGMASMTHIQKYLVPGIELIAMNPKLSISILGREVLDDPAARQQGALGVARMAGHMNQTACASTRIVYVECTEEEDDLHRLEELGHEVHQALLGLPSHESTAPKHADRDLEGELRALALDEEFYRVIGDTSSAGVIVSRTAEEPVEFARSLNNRVVNLVPVPDIAKVCRWVSEETQTVGVFPERLRLALRDDLALHGVQRTQSVMRSVQMNDLPPDQTLRLPHDGMEPLRRAVRWVVDTSVDVV